MLQATCIIIIKIKQKNNFMDATFIINGWQCCMAIILIFFGNVECNIHFLLIWFVVCSPNRILWLMLKNFVLSLTLSASLSANFFSFKICSILCKFWMIIRLNAWSWTYKSGAFSFTKYLYFILNSIVLKLFWVATFSMYCESCSDSMKYSVASSHTSSVSFKALLTRDRKTCNFSETADLSPANFSIISTWRSMRSRDKAIVSKINSMSSRFSASSPSRLTSGRVFWRKKKIYGLGNA